MTRVPSNPKRSGPEGSTPFQVLFDPQKSDTELFDTLAEQQADMLSEINSSQLRRFFGELKDLFRQWRSSSATLKNDQEREDHYKRQYEPRFKMIRSKVSYATRAGGQSKLDEKFAKLFMVGISRVNSWKDFERFVTHVEAVVGFMYGKGKVTERRR